MNAPQEEDISPHTSDDTSSQSHDSDDEDSDSTDEHALEQPVYDKMDDVYRCPDPGCGWEVAFGRCQGCHTKYMGDIVEVRQCPLVSAAGCPRSCPVVG